MEQTPAKPSWPPGVRIAHAAQNIVDGVQRHQWLFLAFASALYFLETYRIVSTTPFNGDEFFTFYLSQLPSVKDIWITLSRGLEVTPPAIHLSTRMIEQWFGPGPFASRFVSILGFWVMLLSVYIFVERRCAAVYAAAASIFPVFTSAYAASCRVRPYGLVLAGCGLSLVFWQRATEGGRRAMALVGLSLSLALAIASHYYSVLLLVPFAAGELVRWRVRRRPDWPVWIALSAALMPLVLFIPLIRSSWQQAVLYSSITRFSFFHVFVIYRTNVHPLLLMLLLVLVVGSARNRLRVAADPRQGSGRNSIPAHEGVTVVVLALLPFVLFLSASLVTKAFFWHYAASFVVGLAILFGLAASEATSDDHVLAAALFLAMGILIAGAVYKKAEVANAGTWDTLRAVSSPLFSVDQRLPIGIASPGVFLALQHYAPASLSARLYYIAADDPSKKSADNDMTVLNTWIKFNMITYSSLLDAHPCFLVYENYDRLDARPVIDRLVADRKKAYLKARDEFGELFLVENTVAVHGEEGSAPGSCEAR